MKRYERTFFNGDNVEHIYVSHGRVHVMLKGQKGDIIIDDKDALKSVFNGLILETEALNKHFRLLNARRDSEADSC